MNGGDMIAFLLILLLISIFLEGTMTVLPLVFICLLCLTILMRDQLIFFIAFFAGMLLDAFLLRPIGETSIFFLLVVFLIFLYQRKYEINSYPFVFIASFCGSFLSLLVFGYANAFVDASASSLIALLLFVCIRITNLKLQNSNNHS